MELYVFVFLFGFVSANCRNECDLRRIDSIRPEPDCSAAGGICTVAADCPRGNLAKQGLCPTQQYMGVECCYGISVKETRCQKLGGECFSIEESNCRPDQTTIRARDCKQGFKCCALV